jgi:hypothetical protein
LDTASFEQLEAQMRFRVLGTNTTKHRFYTKKRKAGEPHQLDDPGIMWEDMSKAVYARYDFY